MKSNQVNKHYIKEEQLLNDAYRLGVKIYNAGCKPTFVVGLWRGGSSVGIYVQECLQYLNIQTDHIAIRTSYRGLMHYDSMVKNPEANIRVHGTQYLLENLNAEDSLLIVDDVCGSGLTLDVVLKRLKMRLKRNMPKEVNIATIWNKPDKRRTDINPDFYIHDTNDWLVLPYELNGLTEQELANEKPLISSLI